MIPIAISSSEADYIRKLLRSQNRKKPRPGPPPDHLRHPRKIDKNHTEKKVASKQSEKQEYQIIYKDSQVQESRDYTTTISSVKGNKQSDESGDITENTSDGIEDITENTSVKITVRPRGPPRGFFNREKFKQILKSNLSTDRDQSRGENWSADCGAIIEIEIRSFLPQLVGPLLTITFFSVVHKQRDKFGVWFQPYQGDW